LTAARTRHGNSHLYLLRAWLASHAQGMLASLGRLSLAPVSTLMTVAVIAIALALPMALNVLIRNVERAAVGWDGNASLTLFLRPSVSDEQASQVAATLQGWTEVAGVRLVTRAAALADLRERSGFAPALDLLEQNPLPPVLVLRPAAGKTEEVALEQLRVRLEQLPEADFAQVDLKWVQRLRAITDILHRGAILLAALLALAVLLIVGNTIRLEIDGRREEIAIMGLVGATPGFVRRPFLYSGLWYGLSGGLGAWLLISVALWLMQGPVVRLTALYGSELRLVGIDLLSFLGLLLGSALLGLLGSWLAVTRHLYELEPI
jgi:cell division transport system permease protein